MPVQGQDPAWPDKAMFAAILLVLAGAAGLLFRAVYPSLTINDEDLLSLGDDPVSPWGTALCAVTLALGVVALRRQAAWPAYAGSATAVLSLSIYGLVPAFGLLALAFMGLSRREGEETRDDGVQLSAAKWPDKAMATSLFLVVTAGIALTQGILMLQGRFDPIVWTGPPAAAGAAGVLIGLLCLVAAREAYRVERPWLAWAAFVASLATFGFYLIGPLFAMVGMLLLALAHHEGEFDEFAPAVLAVKARRGRRKAAKTA